MKSLVLVGLVIALVEAASGGVVISEWMYNGGGTGSTGEFVEFTNTGPGSVDMTGWSFDDNSRVAGTVSLSAFGVVAPGESVILTDETAANFATIWGLSGVKIIGGNSANLGRNDEINLFDPGGNLVDRLTYGDETYPGTVRTQTRSCNIPATDYGYTVVQTSWVLASEYDSYGSRVSTRGEVGSPGRTVGYAWSDFDHDGDVDLTDFNVWTCCLTGPAVSYDPPPSACTLNPGTDGLIAADFDADGDVDLADFGVFQLCYSGAENPADPACGHPEELPGDTYIVLNGNSISVDGTGVVVTGTKATITAAGTYYVSGTLSDGQIVVNTPDLGLVEIILTGVNITNSTTAPFYVKNATGTSIVLADSTANYLTDPATYVYGDPNDNEPNGALFSDDPLTISGAGSLTVHGNFNDGITSKDTLLITGGTITVIALDDGIRGKDALELQGGSITVTSGGDGLKADNADGPGLGVITISGGTLHVTSAGDAIAAETDAAISAGNFTIISGGGSSVTPPTGLSCKGIKGLTSVVISGGTLNINSADDGVHSNGNITISSPASLTIASHDDAVHGDGTVHVISGSITVTTCYEGVEGGVITIDDGTFHITSSNDAIDAVTNVAITTGSFTVLSGGGHAITIPTASSAKGIKGLSSIVIGGGTFNFDCADDGIHTNGAITISGGTFTIAANSNTNPTTGTYGDGIHADGALHITGGTITVTTGYEGIESPNITIDNGTIHVTTTDDGINGAGLTSPNNHIYINGGYIYVNAQGDGIDSNGSITMTGGTVIVNGPTANDNGAIDYDSTFTISGGFLVAAGSKGMAQAPNAGTQRSVKITYSATKSAGTMAHIQTTSGGTNIVTFAPAKQYSSLVVSSPAFTSGLSCQLYTGGSCTGTPVDGLYQGGIYTPGTLTNTFSISGTVTNVNAP